MSANMMPDEESRVERLVRRLNEVDAAEPAQFGPCRRTGVGGVAAGTPAPREDCPCLHCCHERLAAALMDWQREHAWAVVAGIEPGE